MKVSYNGSKKTEEVSTDRHGNITEYKFEMNANWKEINKIEDIWPLTIVGMQHGKFAIIQGEPYYNCVLSLQGNEEWQYDPHGFMAREWEHINYGIGTDIQHAFENFLENEKRIHSV